MKTPIITPNPPIPPLFTIALVGRHVELELVGGRVAAGLMAYMHRDERYVMLRNGPGPMFSHEDFERIPWKDVARATVIHPEARS